MWSTKCKDTIQLHVQKAMLISSELQHQIIHTCAAIDLDSVQAARWRNLNAAICASIGDARIIGARTCSAVCVDLACACVGLSEVHHGHVG